MIDELISGLLGSTFAEVVGKIAPPRQRSEFGQLESEDLRRRNKSLYSSVGAVGGVSFIVIFVSLISGAWAHDPWQIGLMFGFPFSAMFLFICLLGLLKGPKRVGEFLRFCEIRNKINIHVLTWPQIPLVLLGFASVYQIWV